ncbi:MAG: phosphodiester glycosidase family protein [Armatimonadetes bacterium]|nr:phosphodiester glycosidase family protein [Armatimonadota bacterium]
MGLTTALMLAATIAPATAELARPIRYQSFKEGYVYYHAILADMSGDQVTAEAFYADKLTNAWKMIGVRQPAAAITGTFFGFKSEQPVADVIVDGKLVARGHRGSAVAVDWYGKVHIFDTPFKQEIDLYEYKHLLRGAIRLVRDGKVSPNPKAQHFTDSRLWGRASRTGIGLTGNDVLVMMATKNRVTLSEFGRAMLKLGVRDAVALDGGGSTMLYYRGALVLPPTRNLSTMFILHERPPN